MLNRLALTIALALVALASLDDRAHATTIYAAAYGSGPPEVTGAYSVGADGSIGELPGSPFQVGPSGMTPAVSGVVGLAFTPDGGRAVTSYLFNGGLIPHTVAADGSLPQSDAPTLTPSLTGLAVSPDGRFAYVPTRTFSPMPPAPPNPPADGIEGYTIDSSGALSPISGSPFASGEIGDIAMTPDGRFLYAVDGAQIRSFQVGTGGQLIELAPKAFGVVNSFRVSPDGRFLFAARDTGVTSFTIGADGSLTQNGDPALTGNTAEQIFAIAPDGRHIYMPDTNANAIVTAAVAPDGTLTVIGSTPFEGVSSVEVSPDGRFLFYARLGGANVVGVAALAADGRPAALPGTAPWPSGEPERIMIRPGPTPVAGFNVTTGFAGNPTIFDARASQRAVRYDWDFGDGTTLADGGSTPKHTYARAGSYDARLTVTDSQGCSTRQIYTGQSTSCPGGPSASLAVAVTVRRDPPPVISGLSVTNKRFAVAALLGPAAKVKRGTTFRYRLSEAASVRFTIERRTSGRKVGKKCRPVTRRNASRRKCTLYRRATAFTLNGKAGANRSRFSGKLGRKRKLKPGRYRAVVVATDAAGGKSSRKRASFSIVKP
jgi:PKD repeat protein